MGNLLTILGALVAHGLVEAGVTARIGPVWLAVPLLAVPHLLASAARTAGLAGRFGLANRLLRFCGLVPPVLHYLALGPLGWQEMVTRWTGESVSLFDWPRASFLVLLAPFVLYTLASIDAQARAQTGVHELRRRVRQFQVRMFASTLAPIAIYVLLAAAVGASEGVRVRVETVALWNALFAGGLLALFALFLPFVLRNTWETVTLPAGPERAVLEGVAARAGFRCRELLVWRTGGLVANAAIVGLTPRDRVVIFTDSLLAQLGPRQLAAVFAHEIGHAKRRHVLVFLAWAGALFLGADVLVTWLEPEAAWVALALILAAVAVWALGFGWMSRRFELQADLYSVQLLGDPVALGTALEDVGGGHAREVGGWRHFSTGDRLRFLERVALDPAEGLALDRRLRRLARLGVALFFVAAGLELYGLAATLPADQVRAELRLGNYTRAAERLRRVADPEPMVARLVLAGAELEAGGLRPGEPPTGAELEAAAQAALARGEQELALDYLQLGHIAGEEHLGEVREVLELIQAGELAEARARAGSLPPAWLVVLLEEEPVAAPSQAGSGGE